MGCDIHLDVELRQPDGKWQVVKRERRGKPSYEADHYDGRNYDLFAILADVRNGIAFAGEVTGLGFVPIAPPRGTPEDASVGHVERVADYGIDGHSHSWHSLTHLLNFDWDQTTRRRHLIRDELDPHTEEYQEAKRRGWPTENRATLAEEWHGRYQDWPRWAPSSAPFTFDGIPVGWKEWWSTHRYSDCVGGGFLELMLRMWRWADGRPDDVRIVFFFDN